MFRTTVASLLMVVTIVLAGCGAPTATAPAAPTTAPAAPTAAAKAAQPTTAPTTAPAAAAKAAQPTTAPAAATSAPAAAAAATRLYRLVADGTEARYLVREQLANRNLPNDAVGVTKSVTGAVAIDAAGKIDPTQSKFTVDMASLATDVGMRDGFVRRSVLSTDQFPNAEFVVKEVKGLPSPLPTSGEVKFQVVGDMTVRGVTKPITWDVTANVQGQNVTGKATTRFTFAEFNLTQPRVPTVLSIEDDIRLELDFKLTA